MRTRMGFALLALIGSSGAVLGCSSDTPDPTPMTTDSVGDGTGGAPPGTVTNGSQPPTPVTSMPTTPPSGPTTMPTNPVAPTGTMMGNGGTSPTPVANGGMPSTPSGGGPTMPIGSGGTAPVGTAGSGGMDTGVGGAVGMAGMNAGGSNAGGGGGAAVPTEVLPTMMGEDYSLALPSGATLVANGPTGRITQRMVGGSNRLTTSSVNSMNYGSSFWTAPQSIWSWPPPLDAVDETTPRTDYMHAIDGNAIVFTSPATDQGDESVSIVKRFTADTARDAWVLDFTITNEGSSAISVAPWQISRVVPRGFTFYPTGTSVTADAIPTTDIDGVTWLDYSSSDIEDNTKNIADGAEGWLAHVDGDLLFLKVFPELDQADAAPGEGEIEIYVATPTSYVELEPQGAYVSLDPGATTEPWQVLWLVRTVPAEVDVSLGSASLVEWVRSLVAAL